MDQKHSSAGGQLPGGSPLGNTIPGAPTGALSAHTHTTSKTRCHNWLFTWHVNINGKAHLEKGETLKLSDKDPRPKWDESKMKRLKYQLEAGSENGKLHFQGYVSMINSTTLSAVQKHLDIKGAHMEAINVKNPNWVTANEAYVSKLETRVDGPWEFGQIPKPGTRSDLKKIVESIKTGTYNEETLMEEDPWMFCTYGKKLEIIKSRIGPEAQKRTWQTMIKAFIGPTGTGKTTLAKTTFPNAYIVTPSNKGWFDGYNGQEEVIIDEFAYNDPSKRWWSESEFNTICGNLNIQVPIKGGFKNWKPKIIIITTNDDILRWPDTMRRRIQEVVPMMEQKQVVTDALKQNDAIAEAVRQYMERKEKGETELSFKQLTEIDEYGLDSEQSEFAIVPEKPVGEKILEKQKSRENMAKNGTIEMTPKVIFTDNPAQSAIIASLRAEKDALTKQVGIIEADKMLLQSQLNAVKTDNVKLKSEVDHLTIKHETVMTEFQKLWARMDRMERERNGIKE